MEISTFKDENYRGNDRLSIFDCVIFGIKNPIKIPLCVYNNESNPKGLMSIAQDLKQEKAKFERLLNKNLSDIEFFDLYKSFYRWDNNAIIAECNKDAFPNPKNTIIKTNDVVKQINSEGSRGDFSWWTEWRNAAYEVLTNSDFQPEDRIYTKQEIEKLVKEKKMIVLRTDISYGNELDEDEAHKTSIEMEKINVTPDKLNYGFYFLAFALDNQEIKKMYTDNPKAFRVIREDLKQEKLMKDYEKYVAQYNMTMGHISAVLKRFTTKKNQDQLPNKTIEDIKKFLSQKLEQQTSQTDNEKEMEM